MIKRAVIIGGGICGLAVARALEKRAIEVQIYERDQCLNEVGAGLTLWANAVLALKELDCMDSVIEAGERVRSFSFHTPENAVIGCFDIDRIEEIMAVPSIAIHRQKLVEALAGERKSISYGKELVDCSSNDSEAIAVFSDGEEVKADILLACDGFNSRVRKILLDDRARYSGYTCFRGVVDADSVEYGGGALELTCGDGAQFGILDIGHGKLAWFATANMAENTRMTVYERKKEVLRRFAGWREPIEQVIETTESTEFLMNDISDRKPTPVWARGRVMMLGDAAHPTTPNLGQGACQAIEDAAALYFCLGASSQHYAVFDDLVRRRYKRARYVVDLSRMTGFLCQTRSKYLGMVRDYLIRRSLRSGFTPDLKRLVCRKEF